jgi:hypothetical protein
VLCCLVPLKDINNLANSPLNYIYKEKTEMGKIIISSLKQNCCAGSKQSQRKSVVMLACLLALFKYKDMYKWYYYNPNLINPNLEYMSILVVVIFFNLYNKVCEATWRVTSLHFLSKLFMQTTTSCSNEIISWSLRNSPADDTWHWTQLADVACIPSIWCGSRLDVAPNPVCWRGMANLILGHADVVGSFEWDFYFSNQC